MSVSCECCVGCQVQVPATGRSLVQRGPTECGVSKCDLETSAMMRLRPTRAVKPRKKERVSFGVLSTFESCPFSIM